jgi:DNA polymerase/3'-5' exonuclease PolX
MSDKIRYPREVALQVARELCRALEAGCERNATEGTSLLKVCGSLRRGKASVGDIDLVYIPRIDQVPEPADLLGDTGRTRPVNQVDAILDRWIAEGRLAKRLNKLGRSSWGESNKLAVHVETGVPVDLFSTTREAWWSYIVCCTGSAENNTRIASTAQAKGWKWHPYDGYFSDVMGRRHRIENERDAFALLGLPYLEPRDR